ncbi:embryonic protein UVS.2-like isoform X3 [Limulus polyphemus]|uniref:Embryonic protein UVS.2-like isoform X3 n=1 Tax=Limulus polyphemus TaxID=6850 RepID=A0ABM1RV72_LIMPO|nr:embryonic protein UVS.2-like isoform X3 [Limulus polyphemus]
MGNIISSGYPVSYPNNMDCTYTITKLSGDICWLKITFVDFSLQTSDNCTRDYLEISVGNRFCGNVQKNLVEMYPFATGVNYINLKFITDNSSTSRGFNLAYQLVRCDEFPSSTESPQQITTAEYKYTSSEPETTTGRGRISKDLDIPDADE